VAALAQVWIDFAIVGLNGTLRFRSATAVDLVRAVAGTAAIVVLAAIDAPTLPFFAAYAAAALLAAGVGARMAHGIVPLRPRADAAHWRRVARSAAPYALAAAVYVVHFRIVVILVSLQAHARQAGYYATSFRALEFIAAVAGVVAASVVPFLSRQARDPAALARRGRQVVAAGLGAGVVSAALVLAVAGVLVDVVAGSGGAPAAAVLRIQSVSVLATVGAFAGGAVLLAAGRYRSLLYVNLAALAVTVAVALPLIDAHGARGGAIAAAAGDLCLLAGQLIAVRGVLRATP
jgi:O-antigen/teichoic acid export membrane protein